MKSFIGSIFLMFSLLNNASAATVDVAVTNSGWYTNVGFHSAVIKNYYSTEYSGQRNFFTFDVSSIDTSKVTNAWLTVYTYDVSNIGVFSLFDVITPADVLAAQSGVSAAGQAINQDLGDGSEYGSYLLLPEESNSFITINLNQSFLNDLKNSNGTISLGGVFSVGTGDPYYAFGNSAFNANNVLTFEVAAVPEAEAGQMLVLGLMLAGVALRKKKV
jgi:hypothetical protein